MPSFVVGQVVMFEGESIALQIQFIDGDKITCAYLKDNIPYTVTLNAKFLVELVQDRKP
ncbi:TPA: hypothetical protein ACSP3G_000525 [Aeromonas hydrophila]